jgi:TolA-binding protein
MSSFRNRSASLRGATSSNLNKNMLDDKQYKMKVLENKLKTAESKLNDMSTSLDKNEQQDKILEELNKRLTVKIIKNHC